MRAVQVHLLGCAGLERLRLRERVRRVLCLLLLLEAAWKGGGGDAVEALVMDEHVLRQPLEDPLVA